MSFGNALLNVLAIIAIVAIGGLLVYYLGGLLIKVIDHKKDESKEVKEGKPFVEEKSQQNFVIEQDKQPEALPEPTYDATISDEKFIMDDGEKVENVDYNKATEEKREIDGKTSTLEKTSDNQTVSDVNNLFDENKDFNFDDFDFDAFFDEQNKENQKKDETKLPATTETKPVETQYTDEDLDNLFSDEDFAYEDEKAVANTAPVVANPEPVVVNNVASTNTTTANYVAEHTNTTNTIETTKTIFVDNHEVEDQLRAEIAELKTELLEQKKMYEIFKTQSEQTEQKLQEEKTSLETLYQESEKREQEAAKIMQEQTEKSHTVLSIEEYQARLAVLLERLKENEYELKQNRKEFLPLKRVRKNLDKDKAKLRRREALVAKQKVMLYGVNNIADIDQEKAQKLAEDLDLLEGLKLSVKHCEEVMEENKERYPILETTNRILTTTNNDLKQDIHDCEVAILNLRKANGEDVDDIILEPLELAEVEKPEKRKRGRPKKSDTEKQESQQNALETQEIDLQDVKNSFDEDVTTIVHTAQTEKADNILASLLQNKYVDEYDDFGDNDDFDDIDDDDDDDGIVEEVHNKKIVDDKTKNVVILKKEETKVEVKPVEVKPEIKEEVLSEPVVQIEEIKPQTSTTTTVSVKREEVVKTQTTSNNQTVKTEHKFNFDAEEPSYEDLFAIENEDLFEEDDDFFGNPNKK